MPRSTLSDYSYTHPPQGHWPQCTGMRKRELVFTANVGEKRGSPLLSYSEMELPTAVQGSVFESLDYRSVGILQLGVLANKDNVDLFDVTVVPEYTTWSTKQQWYKLTPS